MIYKNLKKGKQNIDFVIKKTSDGKELIIREVPYHTAKEIIINNHYSKKWNTSFGKLNYGIFYNNELLGVATYGNLMNPKSAENIVDGGEVMELNRLWVDDVLGHNTETMFLSATFTLIKNNTDLKAIQSFADGRLGCGTIYKASSFKYFGYEKSLFYEHKETGETFHQAPFSNTKRPNGMLLLNFDRLKGKLKPFEVKTYKYIFPLYRNVKIKQKEQEYPPYDKGVDYIDDRYPIGLLARLIVMYDDIGFEKGVELAREKSHELFGKDKTEKEIENQLKNNKSLQWFLTDYKNKDELLSELKGKSNEQISLF